MKHVLVYGMTNNAGGIETYLLGLFRRQQGKGVRFDFVSDFPSVCGGEELIAGGAQLHFIPAKSKNLKGHLAGMWRILRQHPEYKTVYFNIVDAGAAVTMLPAFLLGRRIVAHSHNGSTDKLRLHRLCRPVLKLMARRRAACSPLAAEYMFGAAGAKALVIPNAIDARRFSFRRETREATRAALGLEDAPIFIHVGRLSPEKNPLGLIDIFEAIHRKRPDAVLLSVGDGESAGEMKAYLAEKGLTVSVRCLGIRTDVAELLQAADVFLFPSFHEGLGIAVLEAQAAGLPCVISDSIPEMVSVTEPVYRISLEESRERWAEAALGCLDIPRRDTREDLIRAGFDSSCCGEFDNKLTEWF